MADTQLLFGKKSIGGIEIDAFLEETYTHSAQATEYPVEDGSKINDHVVQNPDKISVNGFVGPTSIYATSTTEQTQSNRANDIYFKLVQLKEAGEAITIVTGLKAYDTYIIEELSRQRTADNGKSLEFTMSLTKIRIVKSQTTSLSNIGGGDQTKKQAQPPVDIGKTQGSTGTDTKSTSFLDAIRKQVKGIL